MNTFSPPMPTVRVLLPYFGQWPDYLPLFLDGCRRNPEFNFLFVTDCPPPPAPPNVEFVKLSLADVLRLANTKLGVSVAFKRSYKLCDLRPAYGLIFEDYLRGWDFWEFGDIDCIYGRLRNFASPQILGWVDVFCCRKEYISGVFTLIRNTPVLCQLFRESPDWQEVFGSERVMFFDECAGLWNDLIFGKTIWECQRKIKSFTEVVFDAIRAERICGFFETVAVEDVHSLTEVTRAGVFQNWTGWMLLHFVMCKRRWYFQFPLWDRIPERYFVTRHGFYQENEMRKLRRLLAFEWRRSAVALSLKLWIAFRRMIASPWSRA
jgi:hypothetical protein